MENKTIAEKLEALVKLQEIDSKLDEIKKMRGDLPEEVRDLEDEIAGQETRLKKFEDKIIDLKNQIDERKNIKKECEKHIEKYEAQQMNVRNNREYDALTKEIELQNLEIQISDKKIKEFFAEIETRTIEITDLKTRLDERKKDLEVKKNELDGVIGESEEETKKLMEKREKAFNIVDERLGKAYNKIRANAKNGLAVVSVIGNACRGCFNTVPPQRQSEINQKKKIIICEQCGRILADAEIIADNQLEKKKLRRGKKEVTEEN